MAELKPHDAFIISPIGRAGSDMRAQANWVREAIIEPACERVTRAGHAIEPRRSDQDHGFARITDEVLDHIVNDRLLFAVLADDRPNCYFELGIAIAAARPVIILRNSAEKTHFDIKDYRVALEYHCPDDLSQPAPDHYIERLADTILYTLSQDAYLDKVHRKFDPLGRDFKEWKIYDNFKQISLDDYSDFFERANKHIGLQGITLEYFVEEKFRRYKTPTGTKLNFFELLRAKIMFDACDVSILLMDEDNPALEQMHRRVDGPSLSEVLVDTKSKIRKSSAAWMAFKQQVDTLPPQRADGRKGKLSVTQVRHGVVHYRLSITEQDMILSPYINSGSGYTGEVPTIKAIAKTDIYRQVVHEFHDLIAQNQLLEEEAVRRQRQAG